METVIKDINGNQLFSCEGDFSFRAVVEAAVRNGNNLSLADLYETRLRNADLHGALLSDSDLSYADLRYANLRNADLHGALLSDSDLSYADLRYANLRNADLRNASLRGADLRGADLCGADLSGANLRDADLYGADWRYALSVPCYIPMACPSDGAFVGWKKAEGKLIKLLIPEDAKRSSATSNKCRCDKAKVLSITDVDGGNPTKILVHFAYYHKTIYEVGEMVYPDSFDDDRWNECSNGIHFFIDRQDAINYI